MNLQDHITPDFAFRWIEDGQILQITTFDISTEEKIKAYYDVMDDYIRNWLPEKTYLLLFDSTQTSTENWTRYMRQRAEQAHALIPSTAKGLTSSVVKPGILISFLRPFVEQQLNRKNPRVQTRLFYKYEDALNFLKGAMQK